MVQSDVPRRRRPELNKPNGRLPNWLNAVANKQEYLDRLQMVIEHLHQCSAAYRETVPVHETFRGETVFNGDVEVFDLTKHPKAKTCYGWSYGEPEQFVTVLELPPVKSAQDAVKVGVAHQIKKR